MNISIKKLLFIEVSKQQISFSLTSLIFMLTHIHTYLTLYRPSIFLKQKKYYEHIIYQILYEIDHLFFVIFETKI